MGGDFQATWHYLGVRHETKSDWVRTGAQHGRLKLDTEPCSDCDNEEAMESSATLVCVSAAWKRHAVFAQCGGLQCAL